MFHTTNAGSSPTPTFIFEPALSSSFTSSIIKAATLFSSPAESSAAEERTTAFIPSASSRLRDVNPEGIARAYAEKIGNGVRYLTFTVKILYHELQYLRYLYWMTEDPFQVLVVTRSCVIKGFIESVVPDPSSIGKEYISVKVTVTEGP